MFAWLLIVSAMSGLSNGGAPGSQPAQHLESKLQGLTPAEANLLIT